MSEGSYFVMNVTDKQTTLNCDSLNQYDAILSFRNEVEVLHISDLYSRVEDKVSTLLNWMGGTATKCYEEELNFEGKEKYIPVIVFYAFQDHLRHSSCFIMPGMTLPDCTSVLARPNLN